MTREQRKKSGGKPGGPAAQKSPKSDDQNDPQSNQGEKK